MPVKKRSDHEMESFEQRLEEYRRKLTLKTDVGFRVAGRLCSGPELEQLMNLLADVITGRKTGPFHDVQTQKDLITVTGRNPLNPICSEMMKKTESGAQRCRMKASKQAGSRWSVRIWYSMACLVENPIHA